mgnify:CR=1 FL=1
MSKRYQMTYNVNQQYSLNPEYASFNFVVTNWVYHNSSMMDAIENELENMERFPDAEKILEKISKR